MNLFDPTGRPLSPPSTDDIKATHMPMPVTGHQLVPIMAQEGPVFVAVGGQTNLEKIATDIVCNLIATNYPDLDLTHKSRQQLIASSVEIAHDLIKACRDKMMERPTNGS